MQEIQVQSLGWEGPLVKSMATHSSVLAWEIARIYWRAAVNGVAKSPIRLGDYTTKTIAIISMKYLLCIRQVRRLKQGYKVYDRCQNLKQGSMAP